MSVAHRRLFVVLVCGLVALSCDRQDPLTSPDQRAGGPPGPAAAISDGAHEAGNPDFFFLPPIVGNPASLDLTTYGDRPFEDQLLDVLVVDVCRLDTSAEPAACGGDTFSFTSTTGPGSETVRLEPDAEHYQVDWHTNESPLAVEDGDVFRATVVAGGVPLGFADIEIVDKAVGKGKNKQTGEEFVLKDGATVPLKFRVETAALWWDPEAGPAEALTGCTADCTVEFVPPDGETVVLTDAMGNALAFADFPPGWDPDDEGAVVSVACNDDPFEAGTGPLGTDLDQWPLFCDYRIFPDKSFAQEVVVGVCQVDDQIQDQQPYHAFDRADLVLGKGGPGEFEILPPPGRTPPLVLDCDGVSTPIPSGGDLGLLSEGWTLASRSADWLAEAVLPRPLRALSLVRDGGRTGGLLDFTPINAVELPAGLQSLWKGEGIEPAGTDTTRDFTRRNDGSVKNGVAFAAGIDGQAFDFDGVDDWVSAPGDGIDGLQTLTLEGWVNLRSLSGDVDRFISLDTLGNGKAVIRHDGENSPGQLHFYMNIDDGTGFDLRHLRVENALQAGCFHHVAGTYDGNRMRVYLDGIQLDNLDIQGTVVSGRGVRLSSADIPDSGPEAMDGLLDEATVWRRALSASEVQGIFAEHAGSPDVCPPPIGDVGGSVTDPHLAAVAGAQVVLEGPVTRATLTDASGAYAFDNVPAGDYTVNLVEDVATSALAFPSREVPVSLSAAAAAATVDFDAIGLFDQQQRQIGTGNPVVIGGGSSESLAQTVTTGLSGTLVEVRLPVSCSDQVNLIVEIQGVDQNGVPDGTSVATATVPGSDLDSQQAFSRFSFGPANGPALQNGDPFAVVLSASVNSSTDACAMLLGPVGSYGGGDGLFSVLENDFAWVEFAGGEDLPFRTVVLPPSPFE